MKTRAPLLFIASILLFLGTQRAIGGADTAAAPAIADKAENVQPLRAGAPAPAVVLRTAEGKSVESRQLFAAKPSILIFYRGGWCPYCNTHLGELAKVEPELVKLGYQVLAISPDQPDKVRASMDKGGYAYQLLSDSETKLAQAFGLAFRANAAGRVLPVPAVYIIDRTGTIRFAHWNPDYKKRLPTQDLLAAARDAAAQ